MGEGRDITLFEPTSTGIPHGVGPVDAVVVGASLGGPSALQTLLHDLPADFGAPVAICQHMSPGMIELFAEQLDRVSPLTVKPAEDREPLVAGTVYVAPVGLQMRLVKERGRSFVRLDEDWADSLHVPSIDVLFSSAAMAFGSCAMGVLLTGMGSDGALGMHAIRRAGGHTLCESEASATSYSMPRSAIELGAAAGELPIEQMADAIAGRVHRGPA